MSGIAWCGRCDDALVFTFAFAGAEYYCLGCGRQWGMFGCSKVPESPHAIDRRDAVKAEWVEHAGRALLVPRSFLEDCKLCRASGGDHPSHATDEERTADAEARTWLEQRKNASPRQDRSHA